MTFSLPPHLSYSQWNSYTQCPRNWYLSKVQKAEERQTWYIPIGSAVHNMVEDWIDPKIQFAGRDSISAEKYFYPLVAAQMEIEPDLSKWLAGGPEKAPVVGDLALQKVKDCFEKALEFLDEIDVWEVEYDASGRLPGLEVELKAFVDIIGEHKKTGPGIWDWKTGKSKPKNNFQLETYAAMLVPKWADIKLNGHFAMLDPLSSKARKVDLSGVSPAEVGAKYQKVWNGMKSAQIQAEKGYGCRFCFNQDNCIPNAGMTARSLYYDRSHLEQPPY